MLLNVYDVQDSPRNSYRAQASRALRMTNPMLGCESLSVNKSLSSLCVHSTGKTQ